MAQQTTSKSSARSGSRSTRRKSPAKGRTAAKSRSNGIRSQNARASQGKTRPRASSGRAKASSGSRSTKRNSPAKGRSSAKSRSSGRRSQNGRASQGKTRPRASSGRAKASSSNKGTVDAAKDATAKGANTAADAVKASAKRLKIPAIAAGTGLAGVAAGIAITRNKNKSVLGIPLPSRGPTAKSLGDAAKNFGALAERTGKVAEQVRVASEAIGEDGGPRKSKSAIEVVLEGLTSRSQSRAG